MKLTCWTGSVSEHLDNFNHGLKFVTSITHNCRCPYVCTPKILNESQGCPVIYYAYQPAVRCLRRLGHCQSWRSSCSSSRRSRFPRSARMMTLTTTSAAATRCCPPPRTSRAARRSTASATAAGCTTTSTRKRCRLGSPLWVCRLMV